MLVLSAGIKRSAAHANHRFQLHDVDNLGGAPSQPPFNALVACRPILTVPTYPTAAHIAPR
eukprot:2775059-Prymnesium_polylepis.1